MKTDCYVSDYVLVYLIYCSWDTYLYKSVGFLLDPFCINTINAMLCFVFSVKNYPNKILFKLTRITFIARRLYTT